MCVKYSVTCLINILSIFRRLSTGNLSLALPGKVSSCVVITVDSILPSSDLCWMAAYSPLAVSFLGAWGNMTLLFGESTRGSHASPDSLSMFPVDFRCTQGSFQKCLRFHISALCVAVVFIGLRIMLPLCALALYLEVCHPPL